MKKLILGLFLSTAFASAYAVDMLSCCPGENTATEARFVWHHSDESCVLYLAEADDTSRRLALPASKVHKPVAFRSSDVNYWKYTAEIDSLRPGTEYVYWVEAAAGASPRQKFRYLVVFQHDPWFVYAATKDSFDKSRGYYNVWRHVFDKHKVDLALSGDEHNYIRSKPLRGDVAATDGTIYMVSGQIEESNYSATVTADLSGIGNSNVKKYFDCAGITDASCGACWIEVRPEALTLTSFWDKWQSPDFKVYDTVRITPKDRGFVYDV